MKKQIALLMAAILLGSSALAEWACPGCGRANDSNFCASCGTARPAAYVCAACGHEQGESFRFCPKCGQAWAAATPAPAVNAALSVTSVTQENGWTTIAWTGGAAPYTVWAQGIYADFAVPLATDVYGDTVSVTNMEPTVANQVWIECADGVSARYDFPGEESTPKYPRDVLKYVIIGSDPTVDGEIVETFSAAEIQAARASGGDWLSRFGLPLRVYYKAEEAVSGSMQLFFRLRGILTNVPAAYVETMAFPAGEDTMNMDGLVDLSVIFDRDEIATGMYFIWVYYDGQFLTTISFEVTE